MNIICLFFLTYKTYKWYNVFYVRKSVKSIILRGKSQLHLKSPSLKKIGKYKHDQRFYKVSENIKNSLAILLEMATNYL
jgi:hypothetical protein